MPLIDDYYENGVYKLGCDSFSFQPKARIYSVIWAEIGESYPVDALSATNKSFFVPLCFLPKPDL